MPRQCQITGKNRLKGNKVSHANNKSIKTWRANLHWKRVFDTASGQWVKVRISCRALRTINKKGLQATLRDNGLTLKDIG